jgi:hydrogenase nickel incorporation protein HypA/HybF
MHELAVTECLLKTACEYAGKNQADRVISLNIIIGGLSGIIDESVQFYWDMISEDTICSKAMLHFEKRPARLNCQACGNVFNLDGELIPCPCCGSMHLKVLSGDEFLLDSIEIEKINDK